MIVQLDIANETALMPAMGQVEHRITAVVNHAIKGDVFNLAIAEEDLDAVEFDVVAAHKQLEPRKLAILLADMDRIVIVDEADMTVSQPYPFVMVSNGGRARGCFVFLSTEFGKRFATKIRPGVVMQFDVTNNAPFAPAVR